jgi:hypothetical protein
MRQPHKGGALSRSPELPDAAVVALQTGRAKGNPRLLQFIEVRALNLEQFARRVIRWSSATVAVGFVELMDGSSQTAADVP